MAAGNFFGGKFFGGGFFGQIVLVSGGGEVLSWQEEIKARARKLDLEREMKSAVKTAKQIVHKIAVETKKLAKVQESGGSVDGILANLWKLEERKTDLQQRVKVVKRELVDIQTLLIASQKQKEYDEDEEEIELLLLA